MITQAYCRAAVACVFAGVVAVGCVQRDPEYVEPVPPVEDLGGKAPANAEAFDKFIDRFRTDTLFQMSRIAFPLTVEFFDGNYDNPGLDYTVIERDGWRFDSLEPQQGAEISIDAVSETTTDLVIGGGTSRTYLRYRFRLAPAGWYLDRITDESE